MESQSKRNPPKHNQQILDEAAGWFVDLREGDVDAAGRIEFSKWLRTSPEHVAAYLEVAAFWADVPGMASREDVDVAALLASARTEDNVRPLGASPKVGHHGASHRVGPTRPARLAVAASVAVAAAGIAAWLYWQRDVYTTGIGEQRLITLADGSTVDLNARSRIRVDFHDRERGIELNDGQALFHVAKDTSRPFVVRAGSTRVRAVGTAFDVYRKSTGTTVTVLEGTVAVGQGTDKAREGAGETRSAEASILLAANQQITVTASGSASPVHPANVPAATAWTQRQLVFEGAPLIQVVEEFNRYNRKQMVITAPELAQVRVSGVFSSTSPASLLRFLREQVGLDVQEADGELRISNGDVSANSSATPR